MRYLVTDAGRMASRLEHDEKRTRLLTKVVMFGGVGTVFDISCCHFSSHHLCGSRVIVEPA